jgi:hypothetical protein
MALNTTGPISLAGTTAGQSIEIELSGNGTTQISLNDTNVRSLAGVASGAIVMPTNFYGKSAGVTLNGIFYGGATGTLSATYNVSTRINACGAIVGTEANIGTARSDLAGALATTNGIYHGGYNVGTQYGLLTTRINHCNAIVGTETNVGTLAITRGAASNIGNNVLTLLWVAAKKIINNCGALVSQTTGPTGTNGNRANANLGSARAGSFALYYGGNCCYCCGCCSYTIAKFNTCGTQVGATTALAKSFGFGGGAKIGSNAVFYGGYTCQTLTGNRVRRVNACLAIVGCSTVGTTTNRIYQAGATLNSIGMYYGGSYTSSNYNLVDRVNACGTIVGSETTAGTARGATGGAGV